MKQYKSNAFLKDTMDGILFEKKARCRITKTPGETCAGKSKLIRRWMKNGMKAELRKKQMKTITGTHDLSSPKCIFRQAIYQNRG